MALSALHRLILPQRRQRDDLNAGGCRAHPPHLEWPHQYDSQHYRRPAALIVSDNTAKSSIQVIDRMFTLLDALERHNAPVNLKQLAADTLLHPSTAHRILSAMVQNRMVDRVEPGSYRLGARLQELGRLVPMPDRPDV